MNDAYASKLSRRNLFRFGAAGLAGAGAFSAFHYVRGRTSATAALTDSSVEDARYEGVREKLGRHILLTPQKLGGGTHAVDLATQKTLAWISYWNYGDSCPISHHLAAFPADSGDPYKGFEFVNTTQGGDNVLMYGLRTRIRENGMLG
jgi:hypothetical protein